MALQFHENNISREGKVGIWIFQGKVPMLCLVVGCLFSFTIFQTLGRMGFDLPLGIFLSLLPLLGAAGYVFLCVNGKPPSYSIDLLLLGVYRLEAALFARGITSNPPVLWAKAKSLQHPDQF